MREGGWFVVVYGRARGRERDSLANAFSIPKNRGNPILDADHIGKQLCESVCTFDIERR